MSRIARLMPTVFNKVVVFDDFNRADGALGNAVTGQAWESLQGGFAISNGQAYNTGSSQSSAVVDAGISDCIIMWDIPVAMSVSGYNRVVFRASDAKNLWWIIGAGSPVVWCLYSRVAGTNSLIYSTDIPDNDGDRITVRLSGQSIIMHVNGAEVYSGNHSFNQTATKHGIGGNNSSTPRYDNFKVEAL